MVPMTRFDTATAVSATGANRYAADLDPGYLIGTALNGGYLMAVLQRAALAESAHPHAVSSSYHFLRPGAGGPAQVETETVKRGRTVTTVRATLRQGGKAVVTGVIATGALDPLADPAYTAGPAPVPPIQECRSFDPRDGRTEERGFVDRVDLRFTPDTYAALSGARPGGPPELCGYIGQSRGDGGDPKDPVEFLALAVDSLPPVISVLESWRWAPTVELTWHLRAIPEPGPLAFRAHADLVSDGWFDENVDLWDTRGRLVAQSRQLARVGR